MRTLLLYASLGLGLFLMTPTQAEAKSTNKCAECTKIKDVDDRNLCRGMCERSMSVCGLIKDADKRNFCLAVVRKKPSYCGAIKDKKMQKDCRQKSGKN